MIHDLHKAPYWAKMIHAVNNSVHFNKWMQAGTILFVQEKTVDFTVAHES